MSWRAQRWGYNYGSTNYCKGKDFAAKVGYNKTYRCSVCKKWLEKEEVVIAPLRYPRSRGRDNVKPYAGYWEHLHCYMKVPTSAQHKSIMTTSELQYYNLLNPQQKQKVIEVLFPNHVPEEERVKLLLSCQEIEDMTCKELKVELQKRDLITSGNKSELKHRLKEYIQSDKVWEYQSDMVTMGFCREYEKDENCNIPHVLKELVRQYYPNCIV